METDIDNFAEVVLRGFESLKQALGDDFQQKLQLSGVAASLDRMWAARDNWSFC